MIGLSCYYAWEQKLEWWLYETDFELVLLNYKIKHLSFAAGDDRNV